MAITRFRFLDKFHDWMLKEMSLSSFNLLVGKSGVGKTNVLNALRSVQQAGISEADRANGCEWNIEIASAEAKFLWEAAVSLNAETTQLIDDDQHERPSFDQPYFLKERIVRDGQSEIVNRTEENFIFKGQSLPKLKNTESAISLLAEEADIAPLNAALRRMIFSRSSASAYPFDMPKFKKIRERCSSLDALREASDVHSLVKAYLLQEDYPNEFERVKTDYLEIFDTVQDIKLGRLSELEPRLLQEVSSSTKIEDWLVVGLKEDGVKGWITTPRISSGMHRIFNLLLDLALAPIGTVIMIDEVENSLGVNCLPEMMARFLRRPHGLQCILTSHHPYIIQNIPPEQWQVVTRKGSVVQVIEAKSIPALQTNSAHDKFMQLINLKEFEEGIQ